MSRRGKLWVFDPLGTVGWPQKMTWDPIAGCQHGQTAMGRGEAFVAGVGAGDDGARNGKFFKDAATTAMQCLVHAAALSGQTMRTVLGWAIDLSAAHEPRGILQTHPDATPFWHTLLVSVATGAEETVASTRTTLTNKLRPLTLPAVIAAITPQPGIPSFNADAFVRSTDTLVLICDNNAPANVSPLTTMLFDEVIEAAKRAARVAAGSGRLDPPMRCVCDEIANVAPLPKFPALTSDSRALGIQLMWALQSLSQAEERWDRLGAQTLWDNTVCRIVFGGLADPDTLDKLSRLLGEVDVSDTQLSTGSGGGQATLLGSGNTYSESRQEKRVLRPKEIRELGGGTALAVFGRAPGMVLTVPPWTDRPDARQLLADEKLTRARRAQETTP